MPLGGGDFVVGFMKGSGLGDTDSLGFLVKSADFILSEVGAGPAAGVWHCELEAGLLARPARGGVLLKPIFRLIAWGLDCDKGLALASVGISCAESSVSSGGNCPPRCMRMWCWSTRALVNLRWHSGQEFWTRALGGRA